MSTLETLALALPGLLCEAVRDPVHDDRLLLHLREGRRFITVPRLYHKGDTYVPTPLADGLVRSVRFPTRSTRFGSNAELIASMRDFLDSHARLQPETMEPLTAFALASWFCDAGPVAPLLYLFGPEAAVSRILRDFSDACAVGQFCSEMPTLAVWPRCPSDCARPCSSIRSTSTAALCAHCWPRTADTFDLLGDRGALISMAPRRSRAMTVLLTLEASA